jgi:hypothetical protein
MRCLNRNKSSFYYATYVSKTEVLDEYGNATGNYITTYSSPVLMQSNISAARGEANTDPFGISLAYDKAIITDNMACPITETSILWIDKAPETPYTATSPKHDYIVKRVAKALNSIAYAVQKVDVS